MIDPGKLYDKLTSGGLDFFTGVPDSLLKDFCAYIEDHSSSNIITANEGNAVALAAGHYLATGRPGVVYMQNSGIGNAVNPLISLVDEDVYKIPVLLIVGWRGEPGLKDEPQHMKQGKLTLPLIECLGIEYSVVERDSDIDQLLSQAEEKLKNKKPYVFVVKKGVFGPYKLKKIKPDISSLNKEAALEIVVAGLRKDSLIVSTTGKLSRELFEIREKRNETHNRDFLTVGSMGHTSQIAMGVAISNPDRDVFCLDGDGSVIMHMGSLAVNASIKPANFRHIVFNNAAHDSVGGQPTVADRVDLTAVAAACGMGRGARVLTEEELKVAVERIAGGDLDFLEILVKKGARPDLGRPTISPVMCKEKFMESM